MFRRKGELKKSKARQKKIKDAGYDHLMNKNYRKEAPFAGWDSADKSLFHLELEKLKEEHSVLDMQEWNKWEEIIQQEEDERRQKEDDDIELMELELFAFLDDKYYDDYGIPYDQPEYYYQSRMEDEYYDNYHCDCDECTGRAVVLRKSDQMDKMWYEHEIQERKLEEQRINDLESMNDRWETDY